MAGESARGVAQRQRAKAERLARSAASWERGAEGEEATADALAQLPSGTWTVLHDRKWPGRKYANVDHIVVGPPGIFVIDSKNWSGRVTVNGDVLRQDGRARAPEVAAAAEAGLAVAGLVPLLNPHLVQPVLCFVSHDELSGVARGVMVCSTSNVVAMLTSRPDALAADQVVQLCLALDVGLRNAALSAPEPAPDPASERAPDVRRSKPAPVAKRPATGSTPGRRRMWSGLAPAVIGLGLAAVLIMRPDVVTGLADDVSGWVVDVSTSHTQPEPKKQHRKKPTDQKGARTPERN